MDKLIDTFCKWDHFGQGIFLLFIAIIAVGGIVQLCKCFVALFRGWPKCVCQPENDNDV